MNQQNYNMMQPTSMPDAAFSFQPEAKFQRVADLLSSAESIVQGGAALTQDPYQDTSLEPTPIAETGVKVVNNIPTPNFDEIFLSRTFMNMPGQAFPKSNEKMATMASSHPSHNQQTMFGSNATLQEAQRMFLQQQLQQQQMQMQASMHQQQQMQQQQQQHPALGFVPQQMNAGPSLNHCTGKPKNESSISSTAAMFSSAPKKTVGPARKAPPKRTRKYQTGQWQERYEELLQFRKENGHLFVPHSYPTNQKLAQWVKRQRYQYKLKHSGHHSTLSDEREDLLTSVGFVYDSHAACWQEHFQSLEAFYLTHGHCNVPSDHPDSSLAIWQKHQRRQLKRFKAGLSSTMTEERFQCLESLGFDWNPRNLKNF